MNIKSHFVGEAVLLVQLLTDLHFLKHKNSYFAVHIDLAAFAFWN